MAKGYVLIEVDEFADGYDEIKDLNDLVGYLCNEAENRMVFYGSIKGYDTTEELRECVDQLDQHEYIKAVEAGAKRENDAPLWVQQFGADYDVPAEVINHPGLTDVSWHNDACPCFAAKSNEMLMLWIDHPNRELRELESLRRFSITREDELIGDTDDINEALAIMNTLMGIANAN